MVKDTSLAVKKRIMFIKGEDFNFLTYNSILILDAFGCTTDAKHFVDHRKLAYLIDFVSSPLLTGIVERSSHLKVIPSDRDRHALATAYSKGAARVHLITRLVCALERRKILSVTKQPSQPALDLVLHPNSLPNEFLSDPMYVPERETIATLKTVSNQLRTMTLSTTLDRLYVSKGVHVWHS